MSGWDAATRGGGGVGAARGSRIHPTQADPGKILPIEDHGMSMNFFSRQRAIKDRMLGQWPEEMRRLGAVPVCAISIVQDEGPRFGSVTLHLQPEMPLQVIADLLQRTVEELREKVSRKLIT
jgi:hypothetical protein